MKKVIAIIGGIIGNLVGVYGWLRVFTLLKSLHGGFWNDNWPNWILELARYTGVDQGVWWGVLYFLTLLVIPIGLIVSNILYWMWVHD